MNSSEATFANPMGEALGPVLIAIRSTGVFEAHIYLPAMTVLAAFLTWMIIGRIQTNGFFDYSARAKTRPAWCLAIFSLCFLVTNSTVAATKTMIIEETDYVLVPDFIAWVRPLHFYITSVALIHLILIWRNQHEALDLFLSAYVQIGLLGGYSVAIYRIINEPIELTDVTTGIGGTVLILWFLILNWDLTIRWFSPVPTTPRSIASSAVRSA